MSWQLVAMKDVGDAIRQYNLHAGLVIAGLLYGTVAYMTAMIPTTSSVKANAVPIAVTFLAIYLIPLLALAFTQGVVVGMRMRGDLKLFLGMPFSRLDLVVGSFAGRSVLVLASVIAGVAATALVALYSGVAMAWDQLLGATALVGVLGVAFVAIAIAASASVTSTTRSGGLVFGTYFLFVFQIWGRLPEAVLFIINGFELADQTPTWVPFVKHLNPIMALQNAVRPVLPIHEAFGPAVSGAIPVYRTVPFALLVLALWIVVPLILGYRRFESADL